MMRQSAFSLIEIGISLVLLSFSMVALHKMLLESRSYFQNSARQQCITVFIWSMTHAFRFLEPALQAETIAYWRQRLKEVEPHSDLRVQAFKLQNRWHYTIQVRWGALLEQELMVQVQSEGAV